MLTHFEAKSFMTKQKLKESKFKYDKTEGIGKK